MNLYFVPGALHYIINLSYLFGQYRAWNTTMSAHSNVCSCLNICKW